MVVVAVMVVVVVVAAAVVKMTRMQLILTHGAGAVS